MCGMIGVYKRKLRRAISVLGFLLVYLLSVPVSYANIDRVIKYRILFQAAGNQYGLDWRLLAAQAKQESGGNPSARSNRDAQGLMQILPKTARGISKELGQEHYNLYNVWDSIRFGTYYDYKQHIYTRPWSKDRVDNLRLMLCAYNAGPHRIKKYGDCPPFRETQNYWRVIFKTWEQYKLRYS